MLDVRFFPVPANLEPYIERPVVFDFTGAIGFTWQFFPTGCYGVSVLVGPAQAQFELDNAEDDGTILGVAPSAMGTWCERSCLALAVSFKPLAAAHLPLVAHDFERQVGAPREALLGRRAQTLLRAKLRSARSVDAKMQVFLQWVESLLLDGRPANARATAIAEVADRMRRPQPVALADAARRVGLQRRQFEREFRRWLGVPPKRYATIARVQQVPQLAWQGIGLAGIAAELGFADQAHMTRTVKEVTGMSPGTWLQRSAASELSRAVRPFAGGRITHL